MNPAQLPIAIITFIGLVALIPAWLHFVSVFAPNMSAAGAFIARFTLPALSLLFVGGWIGGDVR